MLGIHELRLFIISGLLLWCFGVAAFAASAAGRIRRSGRTLLWINRTLGGLFVCLGIRVALLQAR